MKPIIYILLTSSLFALSPNQKHSLQVVMNVADKYPIKGKSYKTTIGAQHLVEQSAGADKNKIGDDGRSFGGMQIQTSTARQIARWFPKILGWTKKLSDHDISKLLLVDLEFSATLAVLHLKHYMEAGWSYFKAISIYNGGIKNYRYVNKVNRAKKIILREM